MSNDQGENHDQNQCWVNSLDSPLVKIDDREFSFSGLLYDDS